MDFYQIYRPLTAAPLSWDDTHREYEPCKALKPYIRCFWGSSRPYTETGTPHAPDVVIPDTCMDIIFSVNFTENRLENSFCGINDTSFCATDRKTALCDVSTFAIRFYAWSAVLFSEESMQNVKNGFFDAGMYFPNIKKEIEPFLFEITSMEERIPLVECILLRHLHLERKNRIVTDCLAEMLRNKGRLPVDKLAGEVHVSRRQIERVFKENIGITPKTLSSLFRYQYVWKDVLYNKDFCIQDAVSRFGYTDQAHLLKEFKKYHSATPREAVKRARCTAHFMKCE